jgi:hypothetical protein
MVAISKSQIVPAYNRSIGSTVQNEIKFDLKTVLYFYDYDSPLSLPHCNVQQEVVR